VYPRDNTFIGDFTLDVRQLDVRAIVATADHHRAAVKYLKEGEMSMDGTKKEKFLNTLANLAPLS
jgi:hypothetical protein